MKKQMVSPFSLSTACTDPRLHRVEVGENAAHSTMLCALSSGITSLQTLASDLVSGDYDHLYDSIEDSTD